MYNEMKRLKVEKNMKTKVIWYFILSYVILLYILYLENDVLRRIPLSNNAVKRHVDDMGECVGKKLINNDV